MNFVVTRFGLHISKSTRPLVDGAGPYVWTDADKIMIFLQHLGIPDGHLSKILSKLLGRDLLY